VPISEIDKDSQTLNVFLRIAPEAFWYDLFLNGSRLTAFFIKFLETGLYEYICSTTSALASASLASAVGATLAHAPRSARAFFRCGGRFLGHSFAFAR
jgi:hypothetical protein